MAMEKEFIKLLAATSGRLEGLNKAWAGVIGYAVKKCHSDRENGLEYVQAALDSAAGGVRKGVASAFRQLNISVESMPHGQFKAFGIRNPKKQEDVFARIKAGDVPDVVAVVDRLPKAKKPVTITAEEAAKGAIDRMLARLKAENPEAYAIANDRICRVEIQAKPNTLTVGRTEAALSNEEADRLETHLKAIRAGEADRVIPKDALLIGNEIVELTAEESDALFIHMQDVLRARKLKAA